MAQLAGGESISPSASATITATGLPAASLTGMGQLTMGWQGLVATALVVPTVLLMVVEGAWLVAATDTCRSNAVNTVQGRDNARC